MLFTINFIKGDNLFAGNKISLIIPAGRPERRQQLDNVVDKLIRGTVPPDEVVIIENISPASRARNIGAQKATGDILIFADDDIIIEQDDLFERVITTLLSSDDIGICGTSQDIPIDADRFQRAYRRQFDRTYTPIYDIVIDSDMATTLFCAIHRSDFFAAGGYDETLPAGEDNFLRHQIRKLGKRVVVAPNSIVYHALPKNFRELCNREKWYGSARAILAKRGDVPLGGVAITTKPKAFFYLIAQSLIFPFRFFYGGPSGKSFGWWPLRAIAHLLNSFYYARSVLKGEA